MNFSRYYRNRDKFIYGFDPNIIYIGFNDFGNGVRVSKNKNRLIWRADYNVFEDSYDLMLKKIISRNPGTKIICGTIMRTKIKERDDWEFPEYYAGIRLEDYNDAIRKVAKKNNCMVADISRLGMKYETLDGSHPTAKGHMIIADAWIKCLDELNLLESSIETYIN